LVEKSYTSTHSRSWFGWCCPW